MAYFIFTVTEAMLLDMLSCILEIAEVHSGVLFDLLVVLMMVLGAVAPNSTMEGQCLVGETALAGATIGSWRG